MLVLGLNTVGEACEAALAEGDRVLAERREPMTQGHDARLAPVVESLMREAGLGFGQLQRIAVIVGPGSFTGVRVGVAFARGLALALDIPSVGITSLEALPDAPGDGTTVLAILPARRRPPERSWWAQFTRGHVGQGEPVEAGAAQLAAMAQGARWLCGQLEGVEGLDAMQRIPSAPTAAMAARLAARSEGWGPARPVYVREPDAAPMRPVGA